MPRPKTTIKRMPDNDNMLRPEITGYINHKIIANTIPITGDIKNSK